MQPVAPIILLESFFCLQHIRCKMLIVSAMQPVTLTIVLKQEQMRHGPRDKNTWARVTGQEDKFCLIHLLPLSNPSWGSFDMPIAHCPTPPFLWIFQKNQHFPIEKSWLCSDQAALPPSPPLSPTLSWLRRAERCSVHKPSTRKTCSVQCGFLTIWGAPFHRNSRQEKKTD